MTTELIRYNAMCRAIDEAHAVDEVKDIRDKAMALEHYASQALNYEAEKRAAEIRIRAERKAGRLLKEMEKAKGGDYGGRTGKDGRAMRPSNDKPKTLEDLGISKDQSSRYQQLAEVPDEDFEEAFESPVKATTSGILSKHRFKTDPDAERRQRPRLKPVGDLTLTVWGEVHDLAELAGQETENPVAGDMTDLMLADVSERLPTVIAWFLQLQERIHHERSRRPQVANRA